MAKKKKSEENFKTITTNRKARHDYFIEDTLEAGLVLTGTEIKSVRHGSTNLSDAYVLFRNGEAWLVSMYIAPYENASVTNHEPRRTRKLLMHRREIDRWSADVNQKGYTCIPLRLYLTRGLAKVEIGLAKGKKQYDKRRDIARKDADRRIKRAMRDY